MPPSKNAALNPSEGQSKLKSSSPVWHEFTWTSTDEPHAARRKVLLQKYPEISKLFVVEPLTFPIVVAVVAFQILMAYWMREASWGVLILCAYVVSGTLNHALNMAIHELSHNLCFETPLFNRMLAVFASLPSLIPSSTSFRRYHMKHHQSQGVDGIDVDLPTPMEVNLFMNSTPRKLFFVFFQAIFYAVRPLFIHPLPLSIWEIIDGIFVFSFAAIIYTKFGIYSMAYLLLGDIFGNGLHPSAGHFIAEHYVFVKGYETYSYYGIMNYFNFNVGYHNEHHDFPRIPWSGLPKVRQIAKEFYDTLPSHTSYLDVFIRYLTDPDMGPFSRVKRIAVSSKVSTN